MRTIAMLLVALGLGQAGAGTAPLREARSANGRFLLRLLPGHVQNGKGQRCRATLLERPSGSSRGSVRWQSTLVNEVAPEQAFVRDDGRFVVTLNEFRRGGAQHALVVYDRGGRLLREFDLRDLLLGDDWPRVQAKGRAVVWLAGARCGFSESQAEFVIDLKWGRQIRIDLEHVEPAAQEATRRGEAPEAAIPPEIAALLAPATTQPVPPGDQSSEQRIAEALERLRAMRERLGEDLPPAVQPEGTEWGGLSAVAGLPIPRPRPEAPVNYLDWLNRFTAVEGTPAETLFAAASERLVKDAPPDDLVQRALKGDPQALNDPAVQAWVQANKEALDLYRQAAEYEHNGFHLASPDDGSLIGALLPHLSTLRQLTRVSIVSAHMLESQGRYDEATDLYLDALRVGTKTARGLTMIESLVGAAIQREAADALLGALARAPDGALDAQALADRLQAAFVPVRPPAQVLQTERAMFYDTLQRMYERDEKTGRYQLTDQGRRYFHSLRGNLGEGNLLSNVLGEFVLAQTGFESILRQADQVYDTLTQAVMLPLPQGRSLLERQERLLSGPAYRLTHPMLSTLLPSVKRYNELATQAEAQRRATLLVARLKAYRQRHGTWPGSLNEVADEEIFTDPVTTTSFVYRRDGDSFLLYSVALDGKDDGERHDPRGRQGDLRYWPPPEPR